MPICNLLVKTLGDRSSAPKKFLLLLDAVVRNQVHAFQIMPADTYSAGSGDADYDPLVDPNDPANNWATGAGPTSYSASTLFELTGFAGTALYVGAQGTGTIWDNPRGSQEMLLWKVISIAGAPPESWRSMDIFQDLPATPGNIGVA
jgi:hypothetical protein